MSHHHVPAPSPVKSCLHCTSVMVSAAHTIPQALLGPLGAAHTLQDGNDDLFEYLLPHRQQRLLQTSDQTLLTAQPFPGQKTLKLCASFLSSSCPLSPQVLRMSHDHGPAQEKELQGIPQAAAQDTSYQFPPTRSRKKKRKQEMMPQIQSRQLICEKSSSRDSCFPDH